MYQIYVDELYGGLSKPNEDEKKKYESILFKICVRLTVSERQFCLKNQI